MFLSSSFLENQTLISSFQTSSPYPSFFLTNARSVFPKIDELRVTVAALRADVVAITRSWLNHDINDKLLFMNSYEMFRCDRVDRKGGGVCVWVNQNFFPRPVPIFSIVPSSLFQFFTEILTQSA